MNAVKGCILVNKRALTLLAHLNVAATKDIGLHHMIPAVVSKSDVSPSVFLIRVIAEMVPVCVAKATEVDFAKKM